MDSTAPLHMSLPPSRSIVLNYPGILENLVRTRQEIEDKRDAIIDAAVDASPTPSRTSQSSDRPSSPDHDAIFEAVEKAVTAAEQTYNKAGVQAMYLAEVVLAKLALCTSYARIAVSDEESKLDRYRESQSSLTAYINALSHFANVTRHDEIMAALPSSGAFRRVIDDNLLDLAKDIAAVEIYEKKVEEYRNGVKDDDVESLRRLIDALFHLELLRSSQRDTTLKLLRNDLPLVLKTATPDGEGLSAMDPELEKDWQALKELAKKIGMAVFGGLSLLVPMLIMVLHPTLLTVLGTTSVFVLVVGILLAVTMRETERKDIVAATVAYAAVLVVFVGTGGDYTGDEPTGSASDTNGAGANSDVSGLDSVTVDRGKIGVIVAGSVVGTLLLLTVFVALWIALARQFPRWILVPFPNAKGYQYRYHLEKQAKKAARQDDPA